jgi:GxxExxY protein
MVHHEGTKGTKDTKERALRVSSAVIGAAIEVHRHLGPGLMESAYEAALARELSLRGLTYARQVRLPIAYKGADLGLGARLDLVVEDSLVIELKAVDHLGGIHKAQLLCYLRLTDLRVGLLINFNVEVLRNGIRRILNG